MSQLVYQLISKKKTYRAHCQYKDCQCIKYIRPLEKSINPVCQKCQHGKCWHYLTSTDRPE